MVHPGVMLVRDTAPFSPTQRAWLEQFLAGLLEPAAEADAFPWHDPTLTLDERLALAEAAPLPQRLMAAMAQLDCGQCGYRCRSYAEALASGAETATGLCVPGARATRAALRALLAERPAAAAAASRPIARLGAPVRVLAAHRLSGCGSEKDVRHVVIDLAGSGLRYLPGDSLGRVQRGLSRCPARTAPSGRWTKH
jgi:sulfite reductase (NADPH) flavoprotein alpha-component